MRILLSPMKTRVFAVVLLAGQSSLLHAGVFNFISRKPKANIEQSNNPETDSSHKTINGVPVFDENVLPMSLSGITHGCDGGCCQNECGSCWDNTYIFGAVDAYRGIIDDASNNNFGLRAGFNTAYPIHECSGIAAQFGMSYGAYDLHGRNQSGVTDEDASIEEQIFFTAGLFRRCNICCNQGCPTFYDRISWGIVWDHLYADNVGEEADEINLNQLRSRIGYALSSCDEIGVMTSFHIGGSDHIDEVDRDHVNALDQGNLYWLHAWESGAQTMLLAGLAEQPGDFLFGARGEVPLNESWSLFGNFHYIVPSTSGGDNAPVNDQFSEEFWNVTFGFVYYPGRNAYQSGVCGRRWMPYMPVADNGLFALRTRPGVQ